MFYLLKPYQKSQDGVSDITFYSATLKAFANLTSEMSPVEIGILLSEEENPSRERGIMKKATELDSERMYSIRFNLHASTKYYYKSYVLYGGVYRYGIVRSFETAPIPDGLIVDMGLSVKWASCNLCEDYGFVSSPEEYGDYYAWGEIEPYYISQDPLIWKDGKSGGYDEGSYSFYAGRSGSYIIITRYNIDSKHGALDDKTTFSDYDYVDDAARARLGGKWHIPTDKEWKELQTQCEWTRTTQNGAVGELVTASNGNSIFLPTAGFRHDTIFDNGDKYWSSTLSNSTDAYAFQLSIQFTTSDNYRVCGLPVRPVTE